MPQLLKPACLEPLLRNKRSHCNEKPVHRNEGLPPLAAARESPRSNEDPTQPKNKKINLKKKSASTVYQAYIINKTKYHYQQNKTLLCSRYSSVVRLKYAGGYGNALKSCLYYWS